MAFNFNWSPLTADADFYARARDLLTAALNKSPKPPIIVDDIFVTELNLGSVPPELEILEIGDLAEDRFRGIFRMSYSGDSYLTLRTRVQANPMNTYLSSKPSFTSPQPLAAAAGLTIPLSITLSEIKLSAIIILVFSKQKGLTLVFQNDPLDSLKVSSTFDSIQFVRDYLQRTIEGQLRNLMMNELPAIIHKLSLRLFCPDQLPREEVTKEGAEEEAAVDPFTSQPSEAVDSTGRVLDSSEIAGLSSEGNSDLGPLFSQKNLLRLAALSNSHRTLSLFTPGIRNVMFRAWTGPNEQHSPGHLSPVSPPSLMRLQSIQGGSATYTFTDTSSLDQGSLPSRPSMTSLSSAPITLGASRPRNARKKKTRVVNLRRPKADSETPSDTSETRSDTASEPYPISEQPMSEPIAEEPEEETYHEMNSSSKVRFHEKRDRAMRSPLKMEIYEDPSMDQSRSLSMDNKDKIPTTAAEDVPEHVVPSSSSKGSARAEKAGQNGSDSSVILEQAWIMKMAGEIARRVYDEKQRAPDPWVEAPDAPPPAYQATQ